MNVTKYLDLYLTEVHEHIVRLERGLSALEQRPDDPQVINELFRHAHSIKGMSASMGYKPIIELAHGLEEALESLKNGRMGPSQALFLAMSDVLDRISGLTGAIERQEPLPEDVTGWLEPLSSIALAGQAPAADAEPAPHPVSAVAAQERSPAAWDEEEAYPASLRVEVILASDTPLLAARAAVILKKLERNGPVRWSNPRFEELGRTDFDGRLLALVETGVPERVIEHDLERIPEVQSVTVLAPRAAPPAPPARRTSLPPAPATSEPGPVATSSTLRVRTEALDRFLETVGELIVHRNWLGRMIDSLLDPAARAELDSMKRAIDALFREVMAMRMLPFETIAHRFTRSVRDLSRDLSKPLALSLSGQEVRLDRAVLDDLVDPINHIIRNCAAHGIEDAAGRRAAGKQETGSIAITVIRTGDGVTIRIEDDGRGMDPESIKRRAVEQRFITPAEAERLTVPEALLLTTIPGFSTAEEVTELSGRGVGMDVVRTKVESLGGRMAIRSSPEAGTIIELSVPLTVAIIKAFLVRSRDRIWAVPVSSVRRTAEVDPALALSGAPIHLPGCGEQPVGIFRLSSLLASLEASAPAAETDDPGSPSGLRPVLVVATENGLCGFVVDGVLGQQEILVKPLKAPLDELREYSGATVLENGQIALILDLINLLTGRRETLH